MTYFKYILSLLFTDGPKERPKLQLAKRSAPVEAAPSTNSSIFGGAKPVDTAAKEREIEEKLEKQKPEKTQNRSRTTSEKSDESIEKPAQKSGNSIFGGARYELLPLFGHQKT